MADLDMLSFSLHATLYLSLPAFAFTASVDNIAGNTLIAQTIHTTSISTNINANSTVAALNDPTINCNSRRFGTPPVDSCQDAVEQLPVAHARDPVMTYGPREAGVFDVYLPKRWISCKSYSEFMRLVY